MKDNETMKLTTARRACATLLAASVLVAACGDDDGQRNDGVAADIDSIDTSTTDDVDTTTTTATAIATDDEPEDDVAGTLIEVVVSAGAVEGGGRTPIDLGETVTIRVTSDVDDSIHLHGYDVEVEIAAGAPTDLTFDATIPGVFEVELEAAGLELLELEIS